MDRLTRLPERIRAKIVVDADGCWVWQGFVVRAGLGHGGGYGQARNEVGKVEAIHRIVYRLIVGDPVLPLDHLCRFRRCCNPDHLEPVTTRENNLRGMSPAAKNARRTHCWRGHEFDAVNTRYLRRGQRECRECDRIDHRLAYRKKIDRQGDKVWQA